jgi:glycosyltransferase involved in cell wall biosynthesis
MAAKKLIFTVTSDLIYDQRMDRICTTLAEAGYEVTLCGHLKKNSIPLRQKFYQQKRVPTFFNKGKLFYLEFNLRMFFWLLFKPANLICGIDLDTAMPAWGVARLKKIPFVYDAHEYFTEMEEVVRRPLVKKVWLWVEQFIIKRTRYAYTVGNSIGQILHDLYGTPFEVIRNVPVLKEEAALAPSEPPYIVYAGMVNEGRGLETLLEAMPLLDCTLQICGDGDKMQHLQAQAKAAGLDDKVVFRGFMEPAQLREVISKAWCGYLVLEDKGKSYYYSLANKFFDYMHAGIPQLTIDFPEYRHINTQHQISVLVDLNTEQIIKALQNLQQDHELYARLSSNAQQAKQEYNWQKESEKLICFYHSIFNPHEQIPHCNSRTHSSRKNSPEHYLGQTV